MSETIDLCDWWTRERIEAEDAVWRNDRFFVDYANTIRDFMRQNKLKSVIELGCGAGYIASELKNEFRYMGVDGSTQMIEFAKEKNPGFDFQKVNIRELEVVREHQWDLVCSFAVLKHFKLQEWRPVLIKMLSIAKYGMIQLQTRYHGHPSIDSGTDAIVGSPNIPHTWVNEAELVQTVSKAKHQIIRIIPSQKSMAPYMDHAAEVIMLTKVQS